MVDITVMVWNIQDFGNDKAKYRGGYVALSAFIARVARQQKADIIFIQEFTRGGPQRLQLLRTALNNAFPYNNADWRSDWIKGAIAGNAPDGDNNEIYDSAHLDFTQSANHEGYAVLWNHNPNKFKMAPLATITDGNLDTHENTMSAGVEPSISVPDNVLSLVMEGRPVTSNNKSPWSYYADGFNPQNNTYPIWDDLYLPTPNAASLWRESARRPCYAVLDVATNGGRTAQLVPVVVYHAPSVSKTADAPAAGTQVTGYTRQLYQVEDTTNNSVWIDNDRAIAGGDFNVNMNETTLAHSRHLSYDSFTAAFGAGGNNNPTAGAACTPCIPVRQTTATHNTTVKLNKYIRGGPITSGSINAYRSQQLDNMFYRGFNNPPVPVRGVIYDLLTAVRPGGSMTGPRISAFRPIITARTRRAAAWRVLGGDYVGAIPVDSGNRPLYPGILNFTAFMDDLSNGQLTSPRRAAEFVHLFISDHLPTSFRFQA